MESDDRPPRIRKLIGESWAFIESAASSHSFTLHEEEAKIRSVPASLGDVAGGGIRTSDCSGGVGHSRTQWRDGILQLVPEQVTDKSTEVKGH